MAPKRKSTAATTSAKPKASTSPKQPAKKKPKATPSSSPAQSAAITVAAKSSNGDSGGGGGGKDTASSKRWPVTQGSQNGWRGEELCPKDTIARLRAMWSDATLEDRPQLAPFPPTATYQPWVEQSVGKFFIHVINLLYLRSIVHQSVEYPVPFATTPLAFDEKTRKFESHGNVRPSTVRSLVAAIQPSMVHSPVVKGFVTHHGMCGMWVDDRDLLPFVPNRGDGEKKTTIPRPFRYIADSLKQLVVDGILVTRVSPDLTLLSQHEQSLQHKEDGDEPQSESGPLSTVRSTAPLHKKLQQLNKAIYGVTPGSAGSGGGGGSSTTVANKTRAYFDSLSTALQHRADVTNFIQLVQRRLAMIQQRVTNELVKLQPFEGGYACPSPDCSDNKRMYTTDERFGSDSLLGSYCLADSCRLKPVPVQMKYHPPAESPLAGIDPKDISRQRDELFGVRKICDQLIAMATEVSGLIREAAVVPPPATSIKLSQTSAPVIRFPWRAKTKAEHKADAFFVKHFRPELKFDSNMAIHRANNFILPGFSSFITAASAAATATPAAAAVVSSKDDSGGSGGDSNGGGGGGDDDDDYEEAGNVLDGDDDDEEEEEAKKAVKPKPKRLTAAQRRQRDKAEQFRESVVMRLALLEGLFHQRVLSEEIRRIYKRSIGYIGVKYRAITDNAAKTLAKSQSASAATAAAADTTSPDMSAFAGLELPSVDELKQLLLSIDEKKDTTTNTATTTTATAAASNGLNSLHDLDADANELTVQNQPISFNMLTQDDIEMMTEEEFAAYTEYVNANSIEFQS